MSSRIDGFHGTHEEYVLYLENQVKHLQQCLCQCVCNTPPPSPHQSTPGRQSRVTQAQAMFRASAGYSQGHTLRIAQWTPNIALRRTGPASDPQWKRYANALVRNIPPATAWRQALEEKGIADAMRTGAAVEYLLGTEQVPRMAFPGAPNPDHVCAEDDHVLLERIANYARVASERHATASVAVMLANFQKFVVLSACVVVNARREAPKSHIYEIVRTCIGNVSEEYCVRMLHTAKYMNILIDTLGDHGWDGRAAELIMLWNRKPSFYYTLARSSKNSLEHLKAVLSQPHFTARTEEFWPKENSFFVPAIISQVVKKQLHIAEICHELGYKNAQFYDDSLSIVNPMRVFA